MGKTFRWAASLWIGASVFGLSIGASWAQAEELRISAPGTAYQVIFSRIRAPFETATGIRLVFVGDNEHAGTTDIFRFVESAQAEAGVTAANWRDVPEMLRKAGLSVPGLAQYKYQTIGKDHLEIVLNPANGTPALSNEQIAALFAGDTKNWNAITGKDLRVKTILSTKQVAAVHFFEQKLMNGRAIRKPDVDIDAIPEVLSQVAATPGAIGMLSEGYITAKGARSVVIPKHEEAGRPIVLFTKAAPSARVLKLIHWIRTEAHAYLAGRKDESQ